jgi:acyl carrier protein
LYSLNERLKNFVKDQLHIDESDITSAASFVEDFNADSLDLVELVMAIEEEFGIKIASEDIEQVVTTVGEAKEYIERHLS